MDALLSPGTRIGRYTIGKRRGTGGEGNTYEAVSDDVRRVALKLLHPSLSEADASATRERLARLRRLIGVRHRNVAEVVEISEHDGRPYVVTEWVPGESLRTLLDRQGRLPLADWLPICQGILQGLAFLNSLGMVHRDIKSDNIMIRAHGDGRDDPVLIDLGIALFLDMARLTKAGALFTPSYTAPECAAGGEAAIGFNADLFSLGIVSFETVTGAYPFRARTLPELCALMASPDRPSIRALVPDFPHDLEAFIHTMMKPNPKDRFASPSQALEVLAAITAGTGFSFKPPRCMKAAVAPPAPGSRVLAATPSTCAHMLEVRSGRHEGTHIPVPHGGVSLGRADINPGDPTMSRFHFRAVAQGGRLHIRDMGSRSGLAYRDRQCRSVCLSVGEEFRVGSTVLAYVGKARGE